MRSGSTLTLAVLSLLATASAQTLNWTTTLDRRSGHALAVNPRDGGIVLFGGTGGTSRQLYGDTWIRDGRTGRWSQRIFAEQPLPRAGHAMANVASGPLSAAASAVLFGGGTKITWTFDGNNFVREGQLPPAERRDHAMASFPSKNLAIMFGGLTPSNRALDDTWSFDGKTWKAVTSQRKPGGRFGHAMAFRDWPNTVAPSVILFGGGDDETWELSGTPLAWKQLTPATKPAARREHAMAYDVSNREIVLFGGGTSTTTFGDTWVWDASARTWVAKTPPLSPGARSGHALVWDAATQEVLLIGGKDASKAPARDIWAWNGTTWRRLGPGARWRHATAWDHAEAQMLLFGGVDASRYLSDTWTWDGFGWTRRRTPAALGIRDSHALASDSMRRRIVLFGGYQQGTNTFLGDTWEWDGAAWRLRTPATLPPVRAFQAMTFDRARNRAVMFGGQHRGGVHSDTWEWDGADWTRTNLRPPEQQGAAGAFDAARSELVVFGGNLKGGVLTADTWIWNGRSWTKRASAGPSKRLSAMAYDRDRKVVVLFGGTGKLADTWEWNGTSWTRRTSAAAPPGRRGHAMSHDPARREVLLFGGDSAAGERNDLWAWNGTGWTEHRPTGAKPSPRQDARMAYAGSGRTLLFGGRTGSTGIFDDTWLWDGSRWTELKPQVKPFRRYLHGMARDSARGVVVMYGGFDGSSANRGDTWEWSGASWRQITPRTTNPQTLHNSVFAYDAVRRRVVLNGGQNLPSSRLTDETWEWDGADWRRRNLDPPARHSHRIAYDVARGRTVLFGGVAGATVFGDTWEWDGEEWTRKSPAGSPPVRALHAMAYDPCRQRTVVFGGDRTNSGSVLGDTWEWDGTAWARRNPSANPTPRRGHTLSYDEVRGRLVLFGGRDSAAFLSELWEFGSTEPPRFLPFGSACRGSRGFPSLGLEPGSGACLARRYTLGLSEVPALAPVIFVFGFSNSSWLSIRLPISMASLGASGCDLHVSWDFQHIAASDTAGRARLTLPVPNAPSLLGKVLFHQCLTFDRPANTLGFSFSNGAAVQIGR